MPKTKVLLLLHEMRRTGAPRLALKIFEALRDSIDVRILAMTGGPLAEDAAKLGPLEILSDGWKLQGLRRAYHYKVRQKLFLRDLNRWSPDLVYINSLASLQVAKTIPLPSAPGVVHVHEMGTTTASVMADDPELLTNWPSRYIAVSEAAARDLESIAGIDSSRISQIHAFITESEYDGLRRAPGRGPGGEFVVGGCGDPGWRKGITLWLQMAAEVRRLVGPSARFVWVGVQARAEGCPARGRARLMGLEGVVEFVPVTPKPLESFTRFDVFAMTSWEDPCPAVVLESMMLGAPVACFAKGGGSPEEVGDAGLVIDDFCPKEMARRIAELAFAPQERARLGALGVERVRSHFTDRVQIPKIHREIDLVLKGTPGRTRELAGRPVVEAGEGV